MEQNNNFRIIIIDDNLAIHEDFIKILTSNKSKLAADSALAEIESKLFGTVATELHLPIFEIDTASQGREGVEKISLAMKTGNPYALAFVDIRMPPGWDGVETIKHIWELDPNIQVVICTAFSDYSWEQTIEELGQKDNLLILKKPFDSIAVRQLACALTKKWQLLQESELYTSSLEGHVQARTQSLNKSLSLMRATLESSADGVLVVDDDGKISNFNQKFVEMWDIPSEVLASKDSSSLFQIMLNAIEVPATLSLQLKKLDSKEEESLTGKFKFKDKRIFEYYTQPYNLDNKSIGRVWSFRDITKRASLEEALQHQATHDQLTGLPNRVLLLDRLKQAIAKADRNKKMFAVLFIDLDRFKLINDSLSHAAGDEVLCIIARRLQAVLRDEDTLVRLGGDEFVIVINDINNENDLIIFGRKLLDIFKETFKLHGYDLTLTASIGISVYPQNGKVLEILMRDADIAMYHAKELGANQFQFYTEELNQKNVNRLENESALRHALDNNELFLNYQPQFDLKTGEFISVEALIRWKHPTKGIILPLDFIPLAEETGLIVPMGEWVIRTACKQLRIWQDQGLPHIRVAVNITTKQFRLYNLVQIIGGILKETGLEPACLELELTENTIINNIDMIHTIKDLKKLGVQIALDDFGTGNSSLNYLREIPVDRLKIDQSYVQNIDASRGDDVLIQAIITMAQGLNLEVLAEGVETQNQVDFLKNKQCGEVQGYYYSKPLSTSACEELLKTPNKTQKELD